MVGSVALYCAFPETYERIIGEKAKSRTIPIPEKTQPELDFTSELDANGRTRYQTLIGCLQWVVTLERFDIACAVMTMSRFRVLPHQGHHDLLEHVFGYLRKYPDGAIRFRVGIPPPWERSVYGSISKKSRTTCPCPRASQSAR
jgi:hypothetical protein